MVVLAAIGLASFVLVSFVLGVRLVRLSSRTRKLPELMMGLAFLLCGGFGYGQVLASQVVLETHPHLTPLLLASGSLVTSLGACCLSVFTWRVFRAGRASTMLFSALTGTVLVAFVGQALSGDFAEPGLHTFFPWLAVTSLGAVFVWPALESFRYYAMLRRRRRVGLAEPALARVFGWWACGATSASLIYATFAVTALLGVEEVTHPASAIPNALLGVFAAFSVQRAFRGDAAASASRR
ncbi:MAG: hypothetical protein R3263_10325, partial [Myxococcota bacterium]|nr:hypothetical protein [Myxococcota bacterium]